jgi:hypothetical protein
MKRFSHPFMHLLVLAAWSLVMMVVALFLGVAFGISDTESLTHSHNNALTVVFNVFKDIDYDIYRELLAAR